VKQRHRVQPPSPPPQTTTATPLHAR
jgi:hypothetical protein